MNPKIILFILVSFLLATSAQAINKGKPALKQPSKPAQSRFDSKQIKANECSPVCPSGYYYSGRTGQPSNSVGSPSSWYDCKVNNNIKNLAVCATGFTLSWLNHAYDCKSDCASKCIADHPPTRGYDGGSADRARTGCIYACPYTPVCPDGFTLMTWTSPKVREGYTCIFPGYVAENYTFDPQTQSYSPPNSWEQDYCSKACGSKEMVTEPDGIIKCFGAAH